MSQTEPVDQPVQGAPRHPQGDGRGRDIPRANLERGRDHLHLDGAHRGLQGTVCISCNFRHGAHGSTERARAEDGTLRAPSAGMKLETVKCSACLTTVRAVRNFPGVHRCPHGLGCRGGGGAKCAICPMCDRAREEASEVQLVSSLPLLGAMPYDVKRPMPTGTGGLPSVTLLMPYRLIHKVAVAS